MGELLLPGSFDETLTALVRGLSAGRVLRVVNFHATPSYRRAEYRRQFETYARLFAPITWENFDSAFDGTWADFHPDPSWPVPATLPPGWDRPRASRP